MVNEKKLDDLLMELGHRDDVNGTELLRIAVRMYRPGIALIAELYPAIAAAAGTTWTRAERSMRYSIGAAWRRGNPAAQLRCFGWSIDPERGLPTVGHYIARIARLAHED